MGFDKFFVLHSGSAREIVKSACLHIVLNDFMARPFAVNGKLFAQERVRTATGEQAQSQ